MRSISPEFRNRIKIIRCAKLRKEIRDAYFQLAIDLEYDLLTQVEEILLRKKEALINSYNPVIFDDERRRRRIVAMIIRSWRLT